MIELNPQTALRREILLEFDSETVTKINQGLFLQFDKQALLQGDNPIYINNLWDEICEGDYYDWIRDYTSGIRNSGTPTGLTRAKSHRYFESTEVARKLTGVDLYIGWTFWHGGGKYDEPESLPWMEDAYYLNAHTELREVLVFTFLPKAN